MGPKLGLEVQFDQHSHYQGNRGWTVNLTVTMEERQRLCRQKGWKEMGFQSTKIKP